MAETAWPAPDPGSRAAPDVVPTRFAAMQEWLPWVVWAITFVAVTAAASGAVDSPILEMVRVIGLVLGTVAVATIGALVVSRGSAAVPGWLLLTFALFWSVGLYAYHLLELVAADQLSGGVGLARTLIASGDVASVIALFSLLFLFMVPDGTLPAPPWRFVGWVWGGLIVLWSVQSIWLAQTVVDVDVWLARTTLASLDGAAPGPGLMSLTTTLTVASWAALPLVGATLIARYRSSRGEQRQQLKWILFAGLTVIAWFVLWIPDVELPAVQVAQSLVPGLALMTLAAGFGLALFKYRLWDAEVVIRRSLVYGVLWLLIAAVYAAVAAGFGLFAGARFPIEVAILITVLATLVFQPARRRLENLADRWVFGGRDTPVEAIQSFGTSAAARPQPGDIATELAAVAMRALRLQWARVEVSGTPPAELGEPTGTPVVSVPIRWGNESWGALQAQTPPGETLQPDHISLLEALTAQAALTVSHARLVERMVGAQDSERRKIERDIHDGAQQDLAVLIGRLGLARESASGDPALVAIFDQLQAEVRRILVSIRDLAQGIHPPVLRDRGLVAAIEDRRAHLPVKLRLRVSEEAATRRFEPTVEAAAYFTVSEAMTNVVKHSRSQSVDVALETTEDAIQIEVVDHGVGFDPQQSSTGSGITGMTDRIRAVGGILEVESEPCKGTIVRARIPSTRTEVPT
jgi:signal transduction histidine kinase